jgi:hypothetical protein
MSLWGNIDYDSGNTKPKYANTSNAYSNSTINGTSANTNQYYGWVMGVTPTEMTNTATAISPQHPQHAGWASLRIGTGPVVSISSNGGSGINSSGYLLLTDTSQGSSIGLGTGANISYTIANTLNTLQSYSSNSQLNVINTITVVNGGSAWSNASQVTVLSTATAISNATFTVTLGGRAGRINKETLVAMGSMTGHDPRDTPWFPGT